MSNAELDFASLAPTWNSRYLAGRFSDRLGVIAELLGPEKRSGTFWLDAGCGSGFMSHWFADRYDCRVLGVDVTHEMIAHAQPSALVTFEIADALSLPQVSASFDGAICSSVVQFVSDPDQLLSEMRRVLKPGAPLLISIPVTGVLFRLKAWLGKLRHSYSGAEGGFRYPLRRYSQAEFAAKLEAHGFEALEARAFGRAAVTLGSKRVRLAFLGPQLRMFLAVRRRDI